MKNKLVAGRESRKQDLEFVLLDAGQGEGSESSTQPAAMDQPHVAPWLSDPYASFTLACPFLTCQRLINLTVMSCLPVPTVNVHKEELMTGRGDTLGVTSLN